MDIHDVISELRQKKYKTEPERMAYELYYLVANIGELCVEAQKLNISHEQAINKIRDMIANTRDSLLDIEKTKSKKLGG